MCCRHFNLLLENRGERTGTNLMRKHFSNYIKGFPGAAIFRQKLVTAPGPPEMSVILNEFLDKAREIDVVREF